MSKHSPSTRRHPPLQAAVAVACTPPLGFGRVPSLDDIALLVKHAAKYLADGLPECREVLEATANLRERLDTVKSWVDNNCREAENARIGSDDAYKSYSRYCRELHRAPLTRPGFRTTMALKGFEPRRRSDANYFAGLRLLN